MFSSELISIMGAAHNKDSKIQKYGWKNTYINSAFFIVLM